MSRPQQFVHLDGRTFVVRFDDESPNIIAERKAIDPGKPWERVGDFTYWSRKHHRVGSKKAIVSRILKQVKR